MHPKKERPTKRYRQRRIGGVKVYEHRWVMEQHLGRKLTTDELVHHINGNKTDNRLGNLEIIDRAAHTRHHHAKHPTRKTCPMCRRKFAPPPKERGRVVTCSPVCGTASMVLNRWGYDAWVAHIEARGLTALMMHSEQLDLFGALEQAS